MILYILPNQVDSSLIYNSILEALCFIWMELYKLELWSYFCVWQISFSTIVESKQF